MAGDSPDYYSITTGPAVPGSAAASSPAIELCPTVEAAAFGVPTLRLSSSGSSGSRTGAPPAAAHLNLGSEAAVCEAVLPASIAHWLQCQVALRPFVLVGTAEEKEREALFLRDVAEEPFRTVVNGQTPYRPWMWLQHGDEIGVRVPETLSRRGSADGSDDLPLRSLKPNAIWQVYRVRYLQHELLPREAAEAASSSTAAAAKEQLAKAKAAAKAAKATPDDAQAAPFELHTSLRSARNSGKGAHSRRRSDVPTSAKRQSAAAFPKAKAGRKELQSAPAAATRTSKSARKELGCDPVGKVLDVEYDNPTATYRVKVTGYDAIKQWHTVDSAGYSTMIDDEGEDTFVDTLDLNELFRLGKITFVNDSANQ
eukprot:TRINITY_DN54544_c0_g1_i1.p1 TRINITY_DN54544_c0_g1~~TRINITY_DN54544_c0_g1_i1.p1  ORF type:complete len:369 (+),score=74.61 TRINITY_DN54544_c0_g1_i1:59-1165(+)